MMNEVRPILDQQLSRVEAERESLEGTIAEIHTRYSVLDNLESVLGEVESWNLLGSKEITQENKLRPILDQQLSRLEAERESLEGTIAEISRRYSVLDQLESDLGEVESWDLLAPEEITQENGKDYLSQSGEQEVESSEGTVQEEEPEPIPRMDMEETPTFAVNELTHSAWGMFRQKTQG